MADITQLLFGADTDRVGKSGVVGFVTGAGWVDAIMADGLRKCLAEEFSNIYVLHLRGNQRTSGDRSKREGGKIFGGGSRAPIAISILVKNPASKTIGEIRFHDIGDYLSREEKLLRISQFRSISGVDIANGWVNIEPDEHGDWLNQRDEKFDLFVPLASKKANEENLFSGSSLGVVTGRDAWVYNSGKATLSHKITSMIDFFNAEVDRIFEITQYSIGGESPEFIESLINTDRSMISWTRAMKKRLSKNSKITFDHSSFTVANYRPFTKQNFYFNSDLVEMPSKMARIFPDKKSSENRVICMAGPGAREPFSVILSGGPLDYNFSPSGGTQCFPRFVYEESGQTREGELALDNAGERGLVKRDALTDQGLAHFQATYPSEAITKDDLFYYVYGLLHSEEYRDRYADNLSKQLPRIPAVKKAADFWAFVEAGRKLGDLHCDYESVEPYPVTIAQGDLRLANIPDPERFYRVEQMKFAGKRPNLDKTTVIYNANITLTGIPLEAYDYVVNGKPALEWVMERQCVKTDKASGIVNDANRYAIETAGDPAYPLRLFQRVITVSLETMRIVRGLPKLEIAGSNEQVQISKPTSIANW